jgi:hypothetical protein
MSAAAIAVPGLDVRAVAEWALAEIARTPKGHVPASRKGVFAAARDRGREIGFRRTEEGVRLEVWSHRYCGYRAYRLPADLQRRAERMLDSL